MDYYLHYCPYCSKIKYRDYEQGEIECDNCGRRVLLKRSKYVLDYYTDMAIDLTEKNEGRLTEKSVDKYEQELITEEAKENPLYDPNSVIKLPESTETSEPPEPKYPPGYKPKYQSQTHTELVYPHQPKCPTCGSTSIQKISATSKVVGASLFGLFSKTAKSQFKCNNCGYKW